MSTALTSFHMLVFGVFLLLQTSVHGRCSRQTCDYGRCASNEDKCICDVGIQGEFCNMDIIDCEEGSCLNNGTCIELVNGFACQCLPNFDGLRCQTRRTRQENSCKKKCFNKGKCSVINNRQICLCPSEFTGSQCEHHIINPITIRSTQCSELKYRHRHGVKICLAVGLTPLLDAHCECRRHSEKQDLANCQLTPSAYSKLQCSFQEHIVTHSVPFGSTLSKILPDSISVYVCPINWQVLEQYVNAGESVNTGYQIQCQLRK